MNEWSYSWDGQNHIKASEKQLIELISSAKLGPLTWVWNESLPHWIRLKDSSLAEHLVETASCEVSGKIMPKSEMIQYGNQWIDPEEKDHFVTGLMEHGRAPKKPTSASNKAQFLSYQSPTGIGNWAKILLLLFGLVNCAIVSVPIAMALMYSDGSWGESFFGATLMVLFVSSSFLLAPASICYLIWLHRVTTNCMILKQDVLSDLPGMMVGWYFVPVANLWVPHNKLQEIWSETMTEGNGGNIKTALITGCWIATLVTPVIFSTLALVLAFAEFYFSSGLCFYLLIGNTLVVALLFWVIITRISKRQTALLQK